MMLADKMEELASVNSDKYFVWRYSHPHNNDIDHNRQS